MKARSRAKLTALVLAFSILFSLCPGITPAEAAETEPQPTATEPPITPTETILQETSPGTYQLDADCKILNHIDADVFASGNHIARLTEEETLNSYVFLNSDGTKTAYILDEPVKFIDADGTVKEKDITLTAIPAGDVSTTALGTAVSGGYTTSQNDVQLTLSQHAGAGITLSYGGKSVTIIPQGGNAAVTAQLTDNSVIYPNYYGRGAFLMYTPSLSGVKEDIVLAHYTGISSFTFLLQTNGLHLYQTDGRYFLAESQTATERFELGDVVAFDATGHFSVGAMTAETVLAGQSYRLTLTVDEAFLTDDSTNYPVSIDPSLTISDNTHGVGAIEDTTIFSGTPTATANWTYQHCGYYSTARGVGRILMRLNSDAYSFCTADDLGSAEFHIREATGTATQSIHLYANTGSSTWTESGATWNNAGVVLGTRYATANAVSNSDTVFDITELMYNWIEMYEDIEKGFVLVNSNENNTAKAFYSSEYGTTGYRPYIVMTTGTYTPPPSTPTLSDTSVNIPLGETRTLSVNNATGTVTWSSSNTSVATVNSNGVVTGVNVGNATITASVPGYTPQTCTVYVTIPDGIYRLQNVGSGLDLGFAENSAIATLQQADTTNPRRLFKIIHIEAGAYIIRPLHDLSQILYETLDCTYSYHSGTSESYDDLDYTEIWGIYASGTSYNLLNMFEGNDMCVEDDDAAVGTQVIGSTSNNIPSQNYRWNLIPSALTDPEPETEPPTEPEPVLTPVLSETVVDLTLGVEHTLTVSNATGMVTWSSDNESVATVENGIIYTGYPGDASITATVDGYTLTCQVHVVFNDGIYQIKNVHADSYLSFGSCDITSSVRGRLANNSVGTEAYLTQFWKLTHLGGGEYSIRPWHNLNAVLYADTTANNVGLVMHQADTDLSSSQKWRISRTSNGYLVKSAANSKIIRSDTGSTNVALVADSGSSLFRDWQITRTISPPSALLLYDTATGELISSSFVATNPVTKNLELGTTQTPTQLGLLAYVCDYSSTSQAVTWGPTGSAIASLVSTTGTVTSLQLGEVTITASRTFGNIISTVSYKLVSHLPNGTYFIRNKSSGKYVDIQNQQMLNNAVIQQQTFHGGSTQKWIFTHLGDNIYTIHSSNDNIYYYIGVGGNSSDNNQPILLKSTTLNNSMKWKISVSDTGAYIFTSLDGLENDYVLALNGNILQQRSYINNTNYEDEWLLHLERDYSLMFIGYNTGDPLMPPIMNTIEELLIDNAQMTGYASTSMEEFEIMEHFASSKLFACITHGSQTAIALSNGDFSINDVNTFSNHAFDDLEFVYLGACLTGAGEGNATNLVNTLHSKGADTVIGFTISVRVDETNFWTQEFMESIARGNAIIDALEDADNAILNDPTLSQRNDITVLENNRYIVGSTNLVPCD